MSTSVEPDELDQLLTPEEVAARLGVPKSWVYQAASVGIKRPGREKLKLPAVKLGRYVRFKEAAVCAFRDALEKK